MKTLVGIQGQFQEYVTSVISQVSAFKGAHALFRFPWFSGKESTCQCRRHRRCGSTPGSGGTSGEGNGYPLQCSCLENPMNREAWRATVHGVSKEMDTT